MVPTFSERIPLLPALFDFCLNARMAALVPPAVLPVPSIITKFSIHKGLAQMKLLLNSNAAGIPVLGSAISKKVRPLKSYMHGLLGLALPNETQTTSGPFNYQ